MIWFCSILALVSVLASVVIGSLMGGADGILVALAISAAIVMIFGSIALALVALGSFIDTVRGMVRRAAGPSNRDVVACPTSGWTGRLDQTLAVGTLYPWASTPR